MFDILASIIKNLVGLGRFAIFFRKTKKDRFEELEFEMESALYNRWGNEIAPKDVREWFASLPKKYNHPKYEVLKRHVYWKMRTDGRFVHIFDVPSSHKKTE